MRGEIIVKVYTHHQASSARDALAKTIYGRLFSWLIAEMNKSLSLVLESDKAFTINILDIFGFEILAHNSLEQLCINAANERLQQFFVQAVFQDEIECYQREGLSSKSSMLSFVDNSHLLDLLFARPLSVFALLDEESRLQSSSDRSFEQKLVQSFANNGSISCLPQGFRIAHFAGNVDYEISGMIEKNRDVLPELLVTTMANSTCPLLSNMFGGEAPLPQNASRLSRISRSIRKVLSFRSFLQNNGCENNANPGDSCCVKSSDQAKNGGFQQGFGNNTKWTTQGLNFQHSLQKLVGTLSLCVPHFVRCIKPNIYSFPDHFNDSYVRRQLDCLGMVDTIKIRRQGYAFRPTFKEFVEQYEILCPRIQQNMHITAEFCNRVLQRLKLSDYIIGRNRIFLRYHHRDTLLAKLLHFDFMAITMQSVCRGLVARKRHVRMLAQSRVETASAAAFFMDMMAVGRQVNNWLYQLDAEDNERVEREWERIFQEQAAPVEKHATLENEAVVSDTKVSSISKSHPNIAAVEAMWSNAPDTIPAADYIDEVDQIDNGGGDVNTGSQVEVELRVHPSQEISTSRVSKIRESVLMKVMEAVRSQSSSGCHADLVAASALAEMFDVPTLVNLTPTCDGSLISHTSPATSLSKAISRHGCDMIIPSAVHDNEYSNAFEDSENNKTAPRSSARNCKSTTAIDLVDLIYKSDNASIRRNKNIDDRPSSAVFNETTNNQGEMSHGYKGPVNAVKMCSIDGGRTTVASVQEMAPDTATVFATTTSVAPTPFISNFDHEVPGILAPIDSATKDPSQKRFVQRDYEVPLPLPKPVPVRNFLNEPLPENFPKGSNLSPKRQSKKAPSKDWFRKQERTNGAITVVSGPPSPESTLSSTPPLRKIPQPTIAPWFHGIISRMDAEALLYGRAIGSFIVRVSETREGYSVSVVASSRVKHFRVTVTPQSHYIMNGTEKVFHSLHQLVEYFRTVPVASGEPCLSFAVAPVDYKHPDYAELVWDKNKIKEALQKESKHLIRLFYICTFGC